MAAEPTAGEDFVRWVQQAPFEAVVERLEELTEAERRKLSKAVAAAWRGLGRLPSRDGRLALALLGVCAWGDARRLQLWEVAWQDRGRFDAALVRVFAARRPEWIDRWVERELANDWGGDWLLVRQLVRDGICARPTSDAYVIRMVRGRLGAWSEGPSLVEALEADPGLLEDEIWRAFEVDPENGNLFQGEGFAGDAAAQSWGGALCHLAQKGTVDRFRLLEASAEALRRGIQLKGTGFHIRLHEQLAPTPAERERLAPVYLDLLGHRVDAVAAFALRQLKTLAEERNVDGRTLAERLPAALDRQTKAPALAALALLRKLVKDDRELALPAGIAAVRGLGHGNAEVQEKALDFLESLAAAPEPELAAALAARLDGVAPSQRGRAEALLARVSPDSASIAPEGAAATTPAADADALLAEAAALPPRLRASAGIDELLAVLESGGPTPAWTPPAAALPRLDPAGAVLPVASLDELIDLLLACLENADNPVEVERCLDGLCRFGNERPPDFGQRTAALLQRAQRPASDWGDWSGAGVLLAGLVAAWLAGAPPPAPPPANRQALGPELFFLARLAEIVPRFRGGPAKGLLALPTHRGGWIDPRVFVERVRQQLEERPGPGDLDLLQAFLRLAPDGREEALARAAGLAGETGALVRFALGGDEGPPPPAGESFWAALKRLGKPPAEDSGIWPLWIAAGRARSPFGEVAELRGTPVAGEAFAVRPPVYRWQVRIGTRVWQANGPVATVTLDPPAGPLEIRRPLALLAHPTLTYSAADVRVRQQVWPADPIPTLIAGCDALCERLFRPSSIYTPTAAYLEPLFAPEQPFAELARLALCLALVAQDADARTLAVDLAVELMADGRCHGGELGRVYAALLRQPGILKLGRVAAAVAQIAPHGPRHEQACRRCLEEVLAAAIGAAGEAAGPARDLHHLLAPYLELLISLGERCDPRLQGLLAGLGGAGKTARLARQIVEQPGDEERAAARRRLAGLEMLRVRLDYARTWGSRLAAGTPSPGRV